MPAIEPPSARPRVAKNIVPVDLLDRTADAPAQRAIDFHGPMAALDWKYPDCICVCA
jgi:hypothetical protein